MNKKKTLLVSGCSFTKDNYQETWADYLAEHLDYDLINVAGRGAGIDFVQTRLIYQCTLEAPDLVVLMLPSVDRFDQYVDKDHLNKKEIISISSWQNGINPALTDVDGTQNSTQGYSLTGGEIRGSKKYWYKYYYNESMALINYWKTAYSIENFLKIKKIPYYITLAYNKSHLVEQDANKTNHGTAHTFLFNCIDWENYIFYNTDKGFLQYTRDNQFTIEKYHPVTGAHKSWTNNILLPNIKI